MRVLVTNDDGVESAGIVALTRALHDAGHDVFVVAPASDLSGAGASIGPLHRSEPIPVAEHHWAEVPDVPVLAIERPPATAVYLACLGAFGERPDIVASGINPGANTGHLILHSGHRRRGAHRRRPGRPGPRGEREVERDRLPLGDRGASPSPRSTGSRTPGTARHGSST